MTFVEEVFEGSLKVKKVDPPPFKLKYLWAKNPCEKCLVRPMCLQKYMTEGFTCELKLEYKDKFYSKKAFFQGSHIASTGLSLASYVIIFFLLFVMPVLIYHIWW